MTLCKTHHTILCDLMPDAELDRLHISSSDSGDVVRPLDEADCEYEALMDAQGK